MALFAVLANQLSLARDQEEAHQILQNFAKDEGFMSMDHFTFFNLVRSFELPAGIIELLESEYESDVKRPREEILE